MNATTNTPNPTQTIRSGAMAALIAVLTAGFAADTTGQTLPRLGETVRVTVPGAEPVEGWLINAGPTELTILNDTTTLVLTTADVQSIDRWTGGKRMGLRGAAIGGSIGVVAGLVAAAIHHKTSCSAPTGMSWNHTTTPDAAEWGDPHPVYAQTPAPICGSSTGDKVSLAVSTGLAFAAIGYLLGNRRISDSWETVDMDHARTAMHLYAGQDGSLGAAFQIAVGGGRPPR